MSQPPIPPPAESFRTLTRSLSAALEARGLIGWLLAPLLRLILRRRLAKFEQGLAELAALAERVANGTYRPRPEPDEPRKSPTRPPRSDPRSRPQAGRDRGHIPPPSEHPGTASPPMAAPKPERPRPPPRAVWPPLPARPREPPRATRRPPGARPIPSQKLGKSGTGNWRAHNIPLS